MLPSSGQPRRVHVSYGAPPKMRIIAALRGGLRFMHALNPPTYGVPGTYGRCILRAACEVEYLYAGLKGSC